MSLEPTRLYAALVDRLADVPGVHATAAFQGDTCLACVVGDELATLGAGRVIPLMRDLVVEADGAPLDEQVALFEGQLVRVLVRRSLASAFVVVMASSCDVDIVAAHLGRAAEIATRRSSAPASLPSSASSSAPVSASREERKESGFFARVEAPKETIAESAIDALRDLTLETLGFAGDFVFAQATLSLRGEGGLIGRTRWLELVGRLASDIDDDARREAFVEKALALPTRGTTDGLELLSPLARFVVGRRAG